jgi:sporulenol synthase
MYATYHAISALSIINISSMGLKKVFQWLISTQHKDGSWSSELDGNSCVFSTALAVSTLLRLGSPHIQSSVTRGINWLVNNQKADGGWQTKPIMQIPPPDVRDPTEVRNWRVGERGVGSISDDPGRLLTTSTALQSLNAFITHYDSMAKLDV